MDNNYLLIAEKKEGDLLSNVAVYHENTSSCMGVLSPWKVHYEQATVLGEGRALGVKEGRIIFSGSEVFPVYSVSEETHRDIFDHSDDLGKMLREGKELLKDHSYHQMFGFEKMTTRTQPEWVQACIMYEELIREIVRERPLVPAHLEFNRAVSAAYEAGFNGRTVNGRPRVNTGLVELVIS